MIAVNNATDIKQLASDATTAQAAVVVLVDREEQLKAKLGELIALPDNERLEEAASCKLEIDALCEIHKSLISQIQRVQKRIAALGETLTKEILSDVVAASGEVETASFILKSKDNPFLVVVDDLEKIPKEWRREPRPIPSWKEWEPDKNAIKEALVAKTKKSIAGVHIERGQSLVIKQK